MREERGRKLLRLKERKEKRREVKERR